MIAAILIACAFFLGWQLGAVAECRRTIAIIKSEREIAKERRR